MTASSVPDEGECPLASPRETTEPHDIESALPAESIDNNDQTTGVKPDAPEQQEGSNDTPTAPDECAFAPSKEMATEPHDVESAIPVETTDTGEPTVEKPDASLEQEATGNSRMRLYLIMCIGCVLILGLDVAVTFAFIHWYAPQS